ncbi:MAG TPA: EamA family transporter [Vicinamibacterales bacterium]|nr:EamA family transporter [Vicinamibacterales bacterium]
MPKGRAYVAWVVVCLVWGTTYLAIRIAIESLPPLLMAGIRWIIAGSIILLFFTIKGKAALDARGLLPSAARGVLLIGFGNGAVVWAEQTVPSGLTSVFVAIAPFWMVGIDTLLGDGHHLAGRQWAGLFIGFAGIVMLVSPELGSDLAGSSFLRGFIATQLACAGWAVGSIYARRSARQASGGAESTAPAWEMLSGGLALTGVGLLSGEQIGSSVTMRSVAATGYLIVFGSIVAFSAYRYALRHLPVATISLYVYVNTVIAVLLGTLVLGEPFSWRMGIGAGIVLAGIALVKQRGG